MATARCTKRVHGQLLIHGDEPFVAMKDIQYSTQCHYMQCHNGG